jgi:hypothetical protein
MGSIKRLATSICVIGGLVALMVALPAGVASAHEVRKVGSYIFTVGFGAEPVYVGQQNSVQLILTTLNHKPVTNLTDSLKVEVIYQKQKTQLALEPTFDPDTGLGTPGDYRAWFFPTAPGDYTFHFTGSIGSQKIDQSFTSSPTTFDAAQDPSGVEFPIKLPTTTEMSQAITHLQPRVASLDHQVKVLSASNASLHDDVSSNRSLTIVALVCGILGVVGLVIGIVGLRAARSARRTPGVSVSATA